MLPSAFDPDSEDEEDDEQESDVFEFMVEGFNRLD
jgi:hypothetical protein